MLSRFSELFYCDPTAGVLIRKVGVCNQMAGAIAGTTRRDGYVQVRVDGRLYLVHRIIWLFAHKAWPEFELDHIDGNPSNNAISNLRSATHAENLQNAKICIKNSSGCTGVDMRYNKFRARITIEKETVNLGVFDTLEEAIEARSNAKKALHTFQPTQRDTR